VAMWQALTLKIRRHHRVQWSSVPRHAAFGWTTTNTLSATLNA
jgi:hypothetical protein